MCPLQGAHKRTKRKWLRTLTSTLARVFDVGPASGPVSGPLSKQQASGPAGQTQPAEPVRSLSVPARRAADHPQPSEGDEGRSQGRRQLLAEASGTQAPEPGAPAAAPCTLRSFKVRGSWALEAATRSPPVEAR